MKNNCTLFKEIFFVFFTCFALSTSMNAQNYAWAKGIGGADLDYGLDMSLDASGNIYITGLFSGTVDFDPSSATANLTVGGTDFNAFVSKFDASGNYIWAKAITTNSYASGGGVTVDAMGNVYVTGFFAGTAYFDSNAGISLTSMGNEDIFVWKLDASGNHVWAKSAGRGNSDAAFDIAVDASGNIYTTGFFDGIVDFDPNTGTANLTTAGGSGDAFVWKLDASGNYVWAKSMGGQGYEEGRSIVVDISGNVYTIGYFDGVADFDPNTGTSNLTSNGSVDAFVSKLDPSGNYVWAKNIGGSDFDVSESIAVDATGNIYIAGSFYSTVDFDPNTGIANLTANGTSDGFVCKLDASGNYVWAKNIGGPGYDDGSAIGLDAFDNVYITGSFENTVDFDPNAGTANLTSSGNGDIYVSKLDAAGNYIWAKSMGGSRSDFPWSIAIDATDNVYTMGGFSGIADFDPNTGTANLSSVDGSTDVFLSKLASASVGTEQVNNNNLDLYPNPTTGMIYFNQFNLADIEVFTVDGRVVQTATNVSQLDMSELTSGTYFVRCNINNEIVNFRVVKN